MEEIQKARPRRFRPYPEYRDSGVAFLGEIPAGWQERKMGYIAKSISGGTPNKDNPEFWCGDIPWISPKDMKVRVIRDATDHVSELALSQTGLQRIEPPAVLIVVRGMILAHTFPVAVTASPVTINQDMKALLLEKDISSGFFTYLVEGLGRFFLSLIEEAGHGTKRLRSDLWKSTRLFVPSSDEQRAITSFLDRETAKIDRLVAKKERLIELLQEKRTALITRAVTQGLDPTVAMKDSGVEWLGKIPAHWRVRRIAMAVSKITNGYVGPTRDILVDDGVRYLQSLHIKAGAIDFQRRPYFVSHEWSLDHQKSVLNTGDVLVVQTGGIGQVAAVPREFHDCNCHALIILRLKPGLGTGFFLARFLQSDYGQHTLLKTQTGALHPHLECGHVREIPVVLPPEEEQITILSELDRRLKRHDDLVDRVHHAIDSLKEFRTALISAAVTGKIDVREAST